MDAILRTLAAGTEIAVFAMAVDAKNDSVVPFYMNHDFIPFPETPMRHFPSLSTIAE